MPHYDAEDWSDFVRGLIPGPTAGEMEAHLGTCGACQRTVNLFRHVTATARTDRDLAPPDHLVHWALALFQPRESQ